MGNLNGFRCVSCGKRFSPHELIYTCPSCGTRRGTLEAVYDYQLSPADFPGDGGSPERFDIRRYHPLLPLSDLSRFPPLRVGGTPLYSFPRGANGKRSVWIKDDGQNPTASYKDRASALVVAVAKQKGVSTVACASTGNAASSLAGMAAPLGLDTVIFVPATAPRAKVAQLLVYGARVFAVEGTYDEAYDLCLEACEEFGWYNRSAAVNPYLVEGKKTGAFEVAQQLNWNVPDFVFVGVGDGSIISGLCKGFSELKKIGKTEQVPRVIGVQAEGADAVARAFNRYDGNEVEIQDLTPNTVADSIAVGKPRDVVKAVKYVYETGGDFVTVPDDEIMEAIIDLARQRGVFTEPAGAAPFAGYKKYLSQRGLRPDAQVCIFVTGSGLKDVDSVTRRVGAPRKVKPDIDALRAAMEGEGEDL